MGKISRPVRAEINLDNIRYQIHSIRRQVGDKSQIMAVVKADAYGHGALEVSQAALEAGAERLAVALPEEGAELRAAGFEVPIQVFGETLADQTELLVKYDLIPTLCRVDSVREISRLVREGKWQQRQPAKTGALQDKSRQNTGKFPVVVKVDTGMGRLGIEPEEVPAFLGLIEEQDNLRVESLMTHFSTADEADKSYTREQWRRMQRAVELLKEKSSRGKSGKEKPRKEKSGREMSGKEMSGGNKSGRKKSGRNAGLPQLQVANSATIIDLPELALDIVRPGIMLYGLPPSREVDLDFKLKPVMSLKAGITYLKRVPPGTAISYGATYVTEGEELIATLPLGYADGYPRLLSNRGEVLVGGRRCPIRGRVCMDMIMVDVSGVPGVEVGSEAVIIGSQGEEEITATEIAELTDTINYEITCGISSRVPREYLNR